jgi:DNA polymerase-3 subunit epsilon
MPSPGFAVIDFETTGLFPGGHDRVVEVAIVHVDPSGAIEGRWDTLINPGRDLGPQHVHRIQAAEILDAPTFAQITPKLLELLAGRVIVAHNASFDLRFLAAEFDRAGVWGMPSITSLCTMQMAREYLPGAGRALADCCDALDIVLDDAHRAAADALATAQLLAAYIEATDDRHGWNAVITEASSATWPAFSGAEAEWFPRESSRSASAAINFLERITLKMPEYAGPAECLDYLALLDRCLIDRHISAHEAHGLVALAEELGISRTTCEALHLEYFDQLTDIAWADGVLTADEAADLLQVADLLGVPTPTVERALTSPLVGVVPAAGSAAPQPFGLAAGDMIVLTGDMVRPRSEWESHLIALGYKPHGAVTKKVRLVAAADPDSLSGKARKARDYGIPIVGEAWLVGLLG